MRGALHLERQDSERRGRRRMRIADEIVLPVRAGVGFSVYLSDHYKRLPAGCLPGESLWDQVQRQLARPNVGAQLYSRPPGGFHPPGAYFMILLCPGAFANPKLVEEFIRLLSTGAPDGVVDEEMIEQLDSPVAKIAKRFRATSGSSFGGDSSCDVTGGLHGSQHGAAIGGASGLGGACDLEGASGIGGASGIDRLKEALGRMIPIFSTVAEFGSYIGSCPADLMDLGIFKMMFDKWPTTPMMQEVAAKLMVASMLKKEAVLHRQHIRLPKWMPAWVPPELASRLLLPFARAPKPPPLEAADSVIDVLDRKASSPTLVQATATATFSSAACAASSSAADPGGRCGEPVGSTLSEDEVTLERSAASGIFIIEEGDETEEASFKLTSPAESTLVTNRQTADLTAETTVERPLLPAGRSSMGAAVSPLGASLGAFGRLDAIALAQHGDGLSTTDSVDAPSWADSLSEGALSDSDEESDYAATHHAARPAAQHTSTAQALPLPPGGKGISNRLGKQASFDLGVASIGYMSWDDLARSRDMPVMRVPVSARKLGRESSSEGSSSDLLTITPTLVVGSGGGTPAYQSGRPSRGVALDSPRTPYRTPGRFAPSYRPPWRPRESAGSLSQQKWPTPAASAATIAPSAVGSTPRPTPRPAPHPDRSEVAFDSSRTWLDDRVQAVERGEVVGSELRITAEQWPFATPERPAFVSSVSSRA